MKDLRDPNNQIDPKSNPYFQNTVIREYLIKARLINRKGDIIYPSSIDVSPTQSSKTRKTKENALNAINNYISEEERKRKGLIRSQIDLSVKHIHIKNNKKPQPARQSSSPLPINENRSPKRAKSAHHVSRDAEKRLVRRSANEKPSVKPKCRVIMIYYGPQAAVDYDTSRFQQQGDEIIVMQQHCGGENLTVFKGFVKSNETFAFDSQRQADYPFALALYINGLIDCRVSVCCEYKHKRNVPLGGPNGSFAISNIQKVTPCRSCRFIRLKKKSKSKTLLGLEPSRYEKSVVPRLQTRHSSRSPDSHRIPTPPRTTASPPEKDHKKPLKSTDNRPTSSKVRTKTYSKIRSPPVSRTPTPTPKKTDKKPTISSNKRDSPLVPNGSKPTSQSPELSRTPTPKKTNKKPTISSNKRDSPLVPNGNKSISQSPEPSRTPTPPRRSTTRPSRISPTDSEANDKKPPIKPDSPVGRTAVQNNTSDNYTSDFDDVNDDSNPQINSRFGQPRISDAHSNDHDLGNDNVQSKSSFEILNASDSSDNEKNRARVKTSSEKENILSHPRKSGPSEDEDKNRLAQRSTGKNNTADDSRRSSSSTSKKSGPSSSDKNDQNRFSSTTPPKKNTEADRHISMSSSEDLFGTKRPRTAVKKNQDNHHSSKVRRVPSSSSDDFLGIKRTTEEKKQETEVFSKDWFESSSRNNVDTPPKTTTWRNNTFFD